MFLKVLGSSSQGNCYILENDTSTLIIEAGVSFREVKKAIGFNVRKIGGVLISHEHLDHARYIKDYLQAGIPVYSAFQTQTALEIITGELTKAIPPMKEVQIGEFLIIPFNVPHDAEIECYGYLVEHKEMGKLLFLTDLEYCKYNFSKQNINHILVEANYSHKLIDNEAVNFEHILRGHMSLQTALDFIAINDNPMLRNIVLMHLSDKNGNPVEFLQETRETVKYGANCYIAQKGLEVNLSLCPF